MSDATTTVHRHPFPSSAAICNTLGSLFGRVVEGKPVRPFAFQPKVASVVATYVESDGRLAAAWISDVALAASAGAALVVLPANLVGECVKAGKLHDFVEENLLEVLNVAAALFNGPDTPHVKFGKVAIGVKPPDAVVALAKNAASRVDLEVAIGGYAGGRLTLVAT